jgi:Rho family protein
MHTLECSAKHNRGVNEVFYEAARVSIGAKLRGGGATEMERDSGGCVIV